MITKDEGKYYLNNERINSNTMIKCVCKKCNKKWESRVKTIYNSKYNSLCINCSRVQSTIDKYGVENVSQLKETQDKIKENNVKKYGVEYTTQLEKCKERNKQTCLDRYGVPNGGGSKQAQDKIKNTMVDKYGCHYFQTEEFFNIHKKSYFNFKQGHYITSFNRDLYYRSSNELEFIIACEKAYLDIQSGPRLKYTLGGKEHYYYIDFELDNYIVEIKSSHIWYKQNLKSGEILAKQKAAKKYAESIGKEFIFLLDVKDYDDKLKELYSD